MAEGLARLAELESAHLKRLSATHLRAHAGAYSTECHWVQQSYVTAERLDAEARELERGIRRGLSSDLLYDD